MAFRPGNHDRAWNDPPIFSYQQGALSGDTKPEENVTGSSRRTPLNKRIAFPLTGGILKPTTTVTPPHIGLPPPCLPLPISASANLAEASNDQSSKSALETRELLELSLQKISNILHDSLMTYVETEKQEDFNKRLQNLYTSWRDGKLNADIRQRLTIISDSLEVKDFVKAENVRVALAVDYTADCASWIMVIKNIITQMETKLSGL
ncbi:steroid receptor R activator 1-like protein [Daphnia sinensis]|uniref:Steroid receptor R activator 1-like protein n=1 Tax=Daphnia sinensis TaxID=1820382 RepID=A0AAD5L8W6_9CRUS|nr:steroid receptor R activator 1-like protein [Daphnia sinensis]